MFVKRKGGTFDTPPLHIISLNSINSYPLKASLIISRLFGTAVTGTSLPSNSIET